MKTIERIDLHLPKGWNGMTVSELETVAGIFVEAQRRSNKRHPLNMDAVKVEVFLALTELQVLETANPEKPVEEQYLVVCRTGHEERLVLYLWQVHYWISENLKWLEESPTLLRFPYPTETRWSWCGRHKYEGPAALMQNFQWRQYRLAGEYMTYYVTEENRLAQMKVQGTVSERDMLRQMRAVSRAKAMFLATLFNRKIKYIDTETKLVMRGYNYVSWQSMKNLHDFMHYPDHKFQCILFWWVGTMNWLQKKYPKVFKKSAPTKGQKQSNPLELYSRTTATMEKYLGINEEEMNRELYTNVLQHLQDMMDESDRMKELNSKK